MKSIKITLNKFIEKVLSSKISSISIVYSVLPIFLIPISEWVEFTGELALLSQDIKDQELINSLVGLLNAVDESASPYNLINYMSSQFDLDVPLAELREILEILAYNIEDFNFLTRQDFTLDMIHDYISRYFPDNDSNSASSSASESQSGFNDFEDVPPTNYWYWLFYGLGFGLILYIFYRIYKWFIIPNTVKKEDIASAFGFDDFLYDLFNLYNGLLILLSLILFIWLLILYKRR